MKLIYRFHANVERPLRLLDVGVIGDIDCIQTWRYNTKLDERKSGKNGAPLF